MARKTQPKPEAAAVGGTAFDVAGSLEEICMRLEGGECMASIAKSYGVHRSQLTRWAKADKERHAAIVLARKDGAHARLDLAEEGLRTAKNPFQLSKAKELAHHHRYMAAALMPAEYGQKVAVGGAADLPAIQFSRIQRVIVDPK